MSTPNITPRSVTRWKRRKQMAADCSHSLSSEKRLQKLYPEDYPVMVEFSPGVVACREEDDERFNQFLYENRQKLALLERHAEEAEDYDSEGARAGDRATRSAEPERAPVWK